MKKIICAGCVCLSLISKAFSEIDTRQYVDWKNFPNIVKIETGNSYQDAYCTGTEIGQYIITAAHCVEGFDSFTILKNDGKKLTATIKSKGNAKIPKDDWAVLSLSDDTQSKYVLSDKLSSSGSLYGFGALRILTDEEILKMRQFLEENAYAFLDVDEVVKLLQSDIPGVGYIYNDGDRLKKSSCTNIRETNKGIEATCVASSGNSGGGLFVDNNKIVGVVSSGDIMNEGVTFAALKSANDIIQQKQQETCDENFVVNNVFKKEIEYSSHKKIGAYYMVNGEKDGYAINRLTDLCGNVIFENLFLKPYSIEYNNGVYKFITAQRIPVLTCGTGNGLNNELAERSQKIDYQIVLIDENSEKDSYKSRRFSIDGGKTFHTTKEELCASMFTEEEKEHMSEDWKECLKIRK